MSSSSAVEVPLQILLFFGQTMVQRYSFAKLALTGLDLDKVRMLADDFAGRDWSTGDWLEGVNADVEVVVYEETANVNTQLLYLVLNSAVPVASARELLHIVDGTEGLVYDTDWGSVHPNFRHSLRKGVVEFWDRFS